MNEDYTVEQIIDESVEVLTAEIEIIGEAIYTIDDMVIAVGDYDVLDQAERILLDRLPALVADLAVALACQDRTL